MTGSKYNSTCIEERVIETAEYMIETKSTVRQTAKKFGVSKSTVHTVVVKWNGLCGRLNKGNRLREYDRCESSERLGTQVDAAFLYGCFGKDIFMR